MATPVRLQLSRRKGFDLQAHSLATNGLPAVNVARPTMWGNPYLVQNDDAQGAVDKFRRLFETPPSRFRHLLLRISSGRPGFGEGALMDMKHALPSLRDKNLACWCPPGTPCHADVLLKIANPVCDEVR